MEDTIVALSSPPFAGLKAIVRLSGNKSHSIIFNISKNKIENLRKFPAIRECEIEFEKDFSIRCTVFFYKAPNSYTGEDVCEITLPGSIPIVQKLLEVIVSKDARYAQPGEFTKRAFLNGKIDLVQAESILQIIESTDIQESQIALNQLKGSLSNLIGALRQKLLDLLTFCETQLDFSDEDIEIISPEQIIEVLGSVEMDLMKITSFKKQTQENAVPKIVLIGQTNVGKSTIFNRIVQEKRVITSQIPGTTRDYIEGDFSYKNKRFTLVDTAGRMEQPDLIAKLASEKTYLLIEQGDIIFYVVDSSSEDFELDFINLKELRHKKNILVIANKIDLISLEKKKKIKEAFSEIILLSAQTGEGIADLLESVDEILKLQKVEKYSSEFILNARQVGYISKAIASIENAKKVLSSGMALECVALDIRQAITHLEELAGRICPEDVLTNIFSRFCIGK